MASTVEQVNPVVRPLLATSPLCGAAMACAGVMPTPVAGAPGSGTPLVCVAPNNKMLPPESTNPLVTCANAASTFGVGPVSKLKNCDRLPTVWVPATLQLV